MALDSIGSLRSRLGTAASGRKSKPALEDQYDVLNEEVSFLLHFSAYASGIASSGLLFARSPQFFLPFACQPPISNLCQPPRRVCPTTRLGSECCTRLPCPMPGSRAHHWLRIQLCS
ncbi:hypothetical protein AYI70_g6884 [Smittium culicis]|uniref:Uncharacterized protein n=1 Tax=Smittium culicis TaxID=133412 RepID=A0A1R1X064_9FUNG|nr:hypothetical protein AYI70_g11827 [Smittium culicis]OMJ16005.1 hypothetical protein AYI70_g6884 [Smittium culicis]